MDCVCCILGLINSSAQDELVMLLQILEDNRSWIIIENTEDISYDDPPPDPEPGEVVKVRGSLVSFIDRLDDELTKSLQNIDPHTTEYIERLRDEQNLYAVIVRGGIWFERVEKEGHDTGGSASRIVLRRLEHIYYKVLSLLNLANCSPPLSLKIWIKLHGNVSPLCWTLRSLPAQLLLQISSKFSAYISTSMVNPCCVPARCSITSTIMHYKINSTEPATCY
jgi:hypothetical protein